MVGLDCEGLDVFTLRLGVFLMPSFSSHCGFGFQCVLVATRLLHKMAGPKRKDGETGSMKGS